MQVRDSTELLDLMLAQATAAPDIYQPTNYWSVYNEGIVPELYSQGLHDFRRRRKTVLHKFSANDPSPAPLVDLLRIRYLNNRYTRRLRPWVRLLATANRAQAYLRGQSMLGFARKKSAGSWAKPLDALEASLVGNPERPIRSKGRAYTPSILQYYMDYAYCSQFIDFDSLQLVVELGSGSGKQIEVVKKLHPHICFLVFDIPPQLYVCEQYLSAVVPGSVVSFRETRNLNELPEESRGKIFILGNWQFPIIQGSNVDLFWNCASFQEMEPHVVANYLTYVNQSCKYVFLSQEMGGKRRADKLGERGVLQPTTLDDYLAGLANLRMVDLRPRWSFEGTRIQNTFWVRSTEQ